MNLAKASIQNRLSNILILIFLPALILHSCKPKVDIDKLKLDENCLYYNSADSQKRPFSGIAYATFKNSIREDPNTISHTTNFRNGIPEGKYVDYASKGEILQSGEYVPIPDVAELQKYFSSIRRLNLRKTHFDSFESEIVVTVVSSQPNIDSVDLDSRKQILIDFLKKYLTDEELKLIFKVEVSNGEY